MSREALAKFLEEDIGRGDVTSKILPRKIVRAEIVCRERAVIAGLREAGMIFDLVKCGTRVRVREGRYVRPMTTVMTVRGDARRIPSAERTALNLLMRMSGIATETKRFVEEARKINPRVKIASTRKTVPGFRIFDKRAVKVGGGMTHRMRLDDMVLIKDNHLAIVGSVSEAVRMAKRLHGGRRKIETEVRSLREAIDAVGAGAEIIMLDNMTPKQVHSTVKTLVRKGLRRKVTIEVSGGVTHENLKRYASADIDMVSIGSITHSLRAIDFSLEVVGK